MSTVIGISTETKYAKKCNKFAYALRQLKENANTAATLTAIHVI